MKARYNLQGISVVKQLQAQTVVEVMFSKRFWLHLALRQNHLYTEPDKSRMSSGAAGRGACRFPGLMRPELAVLLIIGVLW